MTLVRNQNVLSVDDINLKDGLVNFKEVMSCSDVHKWLEVMNEELDLIKKNDLWEITNLSSQRKVNGRIWVIRKKFKAKKKAMINTKLSW